MNGLKKTLKESLIERAVKTIDEKLIGSSTRGCVLLFFDEPEMPKELIKLQMDEEK